MQAALQQHLHCCFDVLDEKQLGLGLDLDAVLEGSSAQREETFAFDPFLRFERRKRILSRAGEDGGVPGRGVFCYYFRFCVLLAH